MSKSVPPLLLFAFIGFVLSLLVRGSEILGFPLTEKPYVPLGNILVWFLLAAFPLAILSIGQPEHKGRKMPQRLWHIVWMALLVNLVLATLWFPWSRSLTGNWHTTFDNQPLLSKYWTYFTYSLPIFSLLIALVLLSWKAISWMSIKSDP